MEKKNLKESTGAGNAGSFKVPLNLAPHIWDKHTVAPFDIPVSEYVSNANAYDSYDGQMQRNKKQISKNERIALKKAEIAKKNFTQNDAGGNPINGYDPSAIKQPGTPEYIKKIANLPKSDYEPIMIKEDLAVWFGTKKKPKGSKQPKGPWVNICRKKEGGGHPPCGRPEGESKGYPKCRAAGVASKMTDAQKKAACAQKRAAEKKDPKVGKGNKPTMTSYKPKKKNEGLRNLIHKILKESLTNR
jgi:hypothetical protein